MEALIKQGYNVVVLAKKGIYTKKIEKDGATFIEYDFDNKIYYDYEKIKQLLNIFEKYDVKEVHINQFPAMNTVMPACMIANIPYIIYAHMGEAGRKSTFDFFEEQYITYKENFNMLFKYAYKIITISNANKDYIAERYNVSDKEKIIVNRNSINFDEYKSNSNVEQIKNILILGRLEEIHYKSVLDGIELYNILNKIYKNVSLRIAGGGASKQKIEEYVKENNIENVTFLGSISNVKEEIEKSDIVIGMGRCILEAIAMKRIAIISEYTGMRNILSKENLEIELEENFSGKSLELKDVREIAKKVQELYKAKIQELVEYNYNQILEKLDINKNIYVANLEDYKYDINLSELMVLIVKINNTLGKLEEEKSNKIESNWKDHIEYKKWMEQRNNNKRLDIKS